MEKLKREFKYYYYYYIYIYLELSFLMFVAHELWPQNKFSFVIGSIRLLFAAAGVAGIIFLIVTNLGRILFWINKLLVVLLVFGILVLANIYFSSHHLRLDFTESKLHSLSDQSIKVVEALKNDVRIMGFFRDGNISRARMEDLLKIYAYHSPRIKVEFIDPDKNPGLLKRYEIAQDGTTVFECGDKDNRITTATEEDITNAIIKVTREKKKVIYFLEGHGEKSTEVTDENGYSFIKDDLTKMGYDVKKLLTALPESFPKDCALLVIPGPVKDFLGNELDIIKNYLEDGGRVFFLIDPETVPGLIPTFARFGFKLENDIIIDRPTIYGGDYLMPMMSAIISHEITKNFRYATYYPLARSVDVIDPKPDGVATSQVLGKTGESAYTKKNFVLKKGMTVKDIAFDAKKDKRGPIPLAGIATLKPKTSGEPGNPSAEGRLALFGDSDFASNHYYGEGGNSNLFLNVVNWLTEESDLISISPKTQNPRAIQLTPTQGKFIYFFAIFLLSFPVRALAVSIWVRRKSL
ncbi:MAG: Gldg family protein [Candidatus Aminicenantales bacterium]